MKYRVVGTLALALAGGPTMAFADDDERKKARVFQTAPIQANQSRAEGGAWLKRSKNRVDGRVMAKVDHANAPHSIWWVIFHYPEFCMEGCGLDDLGNPNIDAAIFNASGAICAASGELRRNGKPAKGGVINVDFSVLAGEGAGKESQNSPFPPGDTPFDRVFKCGHGLCSEIHVDVNYHVFDGDWVKELTYPALPQTFAIGPPLLPPKPSIRSFYRTSLLAWIVKQAHSGLAPRPRLDRHIDGDLTKVQKSGRTHRPLSDK